MPFLPTTKNQEPFRLGLTSRVYNGISKWMVRRPLRASDRRYNLTTCHKCKFVWFRVAKTGTRSVFEALKAAGVNLDAEHPMDTHYPARDYQNYFRFSLVRNPWDRLVSCWNNKIVDQNWWNLPNDELAKLRVFENFVAHVETLDLDRCDVHLRLQNSVIDLNHVDFVGRFERFNDDWEHIFNRIGVPWEGLPKANASQNRREHQTYYDNDLAQRVGELYASDCSIFGYCYDPS